MNEFVRHTAISLTLILMMCVVEAGFGHPISTFQAYIVNRYIVWINSSQQTEREKKNAEAPAPTPSPPPSPVAPAPPVIPPAPAALTPLPVPQGYPPPPPQNLGLPTD